MTTLTNKSRMATVQIQNGKFVVWVGYADQNEGTIPARWFKGFTTCSNEYKSEKAALAAAQKFIQK